MCRWQGESSGQRQRAGEKAQTREKHREYVPCRHSPRPILLKQRTGYGNNRKKGWMARMQPDHGWP